MGTNYVEAPQTNVNRDYSLANVAGLLNLGEGDYATNSVPVRDSRNHSADGVANSKYVGKLPFHPTFSNESPYSRQGATNRIVAGLGDKNSYGETLKDYIVASQYPVAGKWSSDVNGDGKVVDRYTPSQEMVKADKVAGLGSYFKEYEKGVELATPVPYNNKVYN